MYVHAMMSDSKEPEREREYLEEKFGIILHKEDDEKYNKLQ